VTLSIEVVGNLALLVVLISLPFLGLSIVLATRRGDKIRDLAYKRSEYDCWKYTELNGSYRSVQHRHMFFYYRYNHYLDTQGVEDVGYGPY
jgi:hypothetical protein